MLTKELCGGGEGGSVHAEGARDADALWYLLTIISVCLDYLWPMQTREKAWSTVLPNKSNVDRRYAIKISDKACISMSMNPQVLISMKSLHPATKYPQQPARCSFDTAAPRPVPVSPIKLSHTSKPHLSKHAWCVWSACSFKHGFWQVRMKNIPQALVEELIS